MEEAKIVSLVKKEKVENVILKLVLIVICLTTLVLNLNEYRQIFLDNTLVNSEVKLDNAINTDTKYIKLNVDNAKETRFALENNGKEEAKIYEIKYDTKSFLLVLNENTILTGNINGELLADNTNIKTIKEKLSSEEDNKYYDRYFSNMDYSKERETIKIKFYITCLIVVILIVSIVFDFIKFFHPKKTRTYKRIYKKMFKVKK